MTVNRKFFLGFIRIHILYHAQKEHIYGVQMINELSQHGYKLSPGTLYPILHSLEKEGFLKSQKNNVEGKIRKYYVTTPAGNKILQEALGKLKELTSEVIK
ncbi:MAG: PadR family transcriptional regulator [Methanobacteriaceae archaeon]